MAVASFAQVDARGGGCPLLRASGGARQTRFAQFLLHVLGGSQLRYGEVLADLNNEFLERGEDWGPIYRATAVW